MSGWRRRRKKRVAPLSWSSGPADSEDPFQPPPAPASESDAVTPGDATASPDSTVPAAESPADVTPPDSSARGERDRPDVEPSTSSVEREPRPVFSDQRPGSRPVNRRDHRTFAAAGDRVVHSSLASPRRPSSRDLELDLDAAEREAALEALYSAADDEVPPGPILSMEPVIPVTGLAQADLSPAEVAAATRRAIEQLPGRSARAETCPFLRAIAAGQLQQPRDSIDGRNRCAALAAPQPLSRMQQGLVCLQPAHVNCPRFVRGAAIVQERIAPSRRPERPVPVIVATLLFLVTLLLVVTYVVLQGGLGVSPTLAPTTSPNAGAATATPGAEPSPSPSASATPAPTSRPTPRPTPLPAVYRGLERCSGGQRCFLYVVRRGDTLISIARRFDTTEARLRQLNPRIRSDFLRVGQEVRVPGP